MNAATPPVASDVIHTEREWSGVSFDDIKRYAEAGDPQSQRWLADIYEECFLYNLPSRPGVANTQLADLDHLEGVRTDDIAHRNAVRRMRAALIELCPTVDGGKLIPGDAASRWLDRSAQGGDLIARIRRAEPDPAVLRDLVDAVDTTNDVAAAFWMGDYVEQVGKDWHDPETAAAFNGPFAMYAWQIAACRAGYPCGPGSRLMDQICLTSRRCTPMSYEEFITRRMSPGDRIALEAAVSLIRRRYLSGRGSG